MKTEIFYKKLSRLKRMEANTQRWGWYSDLQAEQNSGYYLYRDIDGNKVAVTEITPYPAFISNFKDAECVGQVNEFLEKVETNHPVLSLAMNLD